MGCYICYLDDTGITGCYCKHLENTLGDEGKYLYLNYHSKKDVEKIINKQKLTINNLTEPKAVNKVSTGFVVNEMLSKGKKGEKIYVYVADFNRWFSITTINNYKIVPLFYEILDKQDILNDFNKYGFLIKDKEHPETPSETKNRLKVRNLATCVLYNANKINDDNICENKEKLLEESLNYIERNENSEYKWAYDYDYINDVNDYRWALLMWAFPSIINMNAADVSNTLNLMGEARCSFIKKLLKFTNKCNSYYLKDINNNYINEFIGNKENGKNNFGKNETNHSSSDEGMGIMERENK